MQRAQVCILKEMHEERLGRLLQRLDRMRLPAELGADVGGKEFEGNFADEAGEGEFLNEEVIGALVFADFFQGDGAGSVAAVAALGSWVAG